MPYNVAITRDIPEAGIRPLQDAGLEPRIYQGSREMSRADLLDFVRGAHGLITLVSDRIDAELLDAAGGQLQIVANYAVGYNNIDLQACTARGVAVTNTPDVLTEATADMTLALLLATARRLIEGDRLARSGRWEGWEPQQLLGLELGGKTLGIIGLGRIGKAVARRARAFGMKIAYHNRSRDEGAETELNARFVPGLDELLRTSDIVSIHAPLTDETRHLIGDAELEAMKASAILINTSRGPLIDERALVDALQQRGIWAAGLDVFENEPELEPGLVDLPNVVLAPHLGSATEEARNGMARICAESILAVYNGEQPEHVLNPDVLNRV